MMSKAEFITSKAFTISRVVEFIPFLLSLYASKITFSLFDAGVDPCHQNLIAINSFLLHSASKLKIPCFSNDRSSITSPSNTKIATAERSSIASGSRQILPYFDSFYRAAFTNAVDNLHETLWTKMSYRTKCKKRSSLCLEELIPLSEPPPPVVMLRSISLLTRARWRC